jgi:putative peptide zinc metalloprotease protein
MSSPPTLATGVELIGEYQGSGLDDPPYLARRPDGQVVQMKRLLFLVAEELDGRRDYKAIADEATDRYGVRLRPDQAEVLVDRLRALGVAAGENGATPAGRKVDPLIALKLRAAVVPTRVVERIATVFAPLFAAPVVVLALSALVALDVWLFGYHGLAQSVRQTLVHPALMLVTLGLIVLATAFHECGHAAACHYGGARPGKIGAGIFVVWPAFYTDVTDAYRLGRAGRIRTDLGGVYFNGIFALLVGAAYFATGFEPILLLIPLQHAEILHQLLPFIRLDGYYVVSDLAGVPDMAARIKPTLVGLLPWRRMDASAAELKPWVRVVTRAYVLTLAPLIALFFGLLLYSLPRMLATTWDTGRTELHTIGSSDWSGTAVAVIQLLLLLIVPVGTLITLTQLTRRTTIGIWRATDGRPAARTTAVAAALGVAAVAAIALAPSSRYHPIGPHERGTLGDVLARSTAPAPARPARPTRPPAPTTHPVTPVTPVVPSTSHRRHRPAATTPTTTTAVRPSPAPTTTTAPVPMHPVATTPAVTVSTPVTTATVPTATLPVPTLSTPTVTTPTLPTPTITTPTLPITTPTLPTVTTPTITTPIGP